MICQKLKIQLKIQIKIKNKNIRSYSPDYNIIPNNYYAKSNINYIAKNKELLKEKEYKMIEERLKKENEALTLLLSKKESQNIIYPNIQSRLYDYELKQKVIKKYNNNKIRSQSSEIRKKHNQII